MSYTIQVNYEVSGSTTPLTPNDYIIPAASNPTTIEAGDAATLNFKADGMYFIFKARKGATATGATATWSCAAPFTEATIKLSNATDNVVITIVVVVNVAPQLVAKPFLYQVAAPVDTRLILTKKEMREAVDAYLPDTYFALCKDDGHFYLYDKLHSKSEMTGKYRLITEYVEKSIKSIDGGEIL